MLTLILKQTSALPQLCRTSLHSPRPISIDAGRNWALTTAKSGVLCTNHNRSGVRRGALLKTHIAFALAASLGEWGPKNNSLGQYIGRGSIPVTCQPCGRSEAFFGRAPTVGEFWSGECMASRFGPVLLSPFIILHCPLKTCTTNIDVVIGDSIHKRTCKQCLVTSQ